MQPLRRPAAAGNGAAVRPWARKTLALCGILAWISLAAATTAHAAAEATSTGTSHAHESCSLCHSGASFATVESTSVAACVPPARQPARAPAQPVVPADPAGEPAQARAPPCSLIT